MSKKALMHFGIVILRRVSGMALSANHYKDVCTESFALVIYFHSRSHRHYHLTDSWISKKCLDLILGHRFALILCFIQQHTAKAYTAKPLDWLCFQRYEHKPESMHMQHNVPTGKQNQQCSCHDCHNHKLYCTTVLQYIWSKHFLNSSA